MGDPPPIVLNLSGHDPSGGAGIQADIEAAAAHSCFACTVLTVLTEQNTLGVQSSKPLDPDWVIGQARGVFGDLPVAAIKIGLLGSAAIARALHELLCEWPDIPVVLDPVLSSGSGRKLVESRLVDEIVDLLIPRTTVLTPNSLEARELAGGRAELDSCGDYLISLGCEYVLITGTHEAGPMVVNRLYARSGRAESYRWPRLPNTYHGSGCTLAASIAAGLAQGSAPVVAIEGAQAYTWKALKDGFRPGKGQYLPRRLVPGCRSDGGAVS